MAENTMAELTTSQPKGEPEAGTAARSWHACLPYFSDGSDSPRRFLERCIERIEALEGQVQAFAHLALVNARQQADDATLRHREGRTLSPLDGMPVGVKDIIETRDMPTQFNSPIFRNFQPRRDAAAVLALKQAGAIIVGKTVTTEFACGRSGPTSNPHDATRTPGGSSSGSAAATACAMLPAALGTQTQASIVRPASFCGVIGYKPTMNALCCDGVGRLAPTLDHLGVLAADLDDARLVASALAAIGPDYQGVQLDLKGAATGNAPRRIVRLRTAGWDELDAASITAFDAAVAKLVDQGISFLDDSDPQVGALEAMLKNANDVAFRIFSWEAQWPLRAYADCGSDLVGDRVQDLLRQADGMSAKDYAADVAWREQLRRKVEDLAARCDAFLTLSSSGPAPVGLSSTGSRSFPVPWTLVGGPAISLPVMAVHGLPLGLQLMGQVGSDAALFGQARWLLDTIGAAGVRPDRRPDGDAR